MIAEPFCVIITLLSPFTMFSSDNVYTTRDAASYDPREGIFIVNVVSLTVTTAIVAASAVMDTVIFPFPSADFRLIVYSLFSPFPIVLLSYKCLPPLNQA